MKKLLSLTLAAALLLALAACGAQPAAIPNPPLVLGEKYLTDLDYEQALLQFDQAIEIEPKNPRGYLGKADALLHLDRQPDAASALADGTKATKGDARTALKAAQAEVAKSIVDGYIGLSTAYEKLGWKEIAVALIKRVCEEMPEESRLREVLEGLVDFVNEVNGAPQDDEISVVIPENVFGMKEFQAFGINLDTDVYAIADRLSIPHNHVYRSSEEYAERDRNAAFHIFRYDFDNQDQYGIYAPPVDPNYHLSDMPAGQVCFSLPNDERGPSMSLSVYSYYSGSYNQVRFDLLPGIGIGTHVEDIVRRFYIDEDAVVFENGIPVMEPDSGIELYRFVLPDDRGYATGGIWRYSDGEEYLLSYSYTDEKKLDYLVRLEFRDGIVTEISYAVPNNNN